MGSLFFWWIATNLIYKGLKNIFQKQLSQQQLAVCQPHDL